MGERRDDEVENRTKTGSHKRDKHDSQGNSDTETERVESEEARDRESKAKTAQTNHKEPTQTDKPQNNLSTDSETVVGANSNLLLPSSDSPATHSGPATGQWNRCSDTHTDKIKRGQLGSEERDATITHTEEDWQVVCRNHRGTTNSTNLEEENKLRTGGTKNGTKQGNKKGGEGGGGPKHPTTSNKDTTKHTAPGQTTLSWPGVRMIGSKTEASKRGTHTGKTTPARSHTKTKTNNSPAITRSKAPTTSTSTANTPTAATTNK